MIRTVADSRRRRAAVVVAALMVAAVALSGCLATPRTPPPSPTPDTSGVADALLPYYGQTIEWTSCGDGLDCASVRAPLDWDDPGRAEIELAVIRHRATSGAPQGALLTNPGGPGSSGVAIVRDALGVVARPAVQDAYDIVGFDPRGVGQSTAVRCYDAADMDAYLYAIPTEPRGSAAATAESDARNRAFAEACDARSGGILPFVSTRSAARDMDVLRAVLGQEKLDYLGYSYGTFLGATYADLYPQRVGRMVLDGALDPTASSLDVSVTQGIGFDASLRAFMADCLGRERCPFSGDVERAMADLGRLLASVDAAPLVGTDGRRLGADTLLTAVVAALYSPGSWPTLRNALGEALAGRADAALALADIYNGRTGGAYPTNSTEAFRAYNCMDYPHDYSDQELAAARARLDAEAPTIAPYWLGVDPCRVWPYPATGVRAPLTAVGAAPILVIGTTGDPATPYAWSVALADQLASGVLITRVGEGHTGYNKGNACVNEAVEGYLLAGVVLVDGLRCE